ncbi:MAG: acyltransferase family protein [Gammaproteobacteria bacterium]
MTHLPSRVKFRNDINGLRAWAVVAVLLFHFKLFGLDGGFIGVDIFFVISGFLMTSIIVKDLEANSFSLSEFYIARARRILPALIVLTITLLALGWFWLTEPDYKELGHQSTYALTFISNIYFWRKTGYFDTAAHEKWLLHTWSLSVEWQFYLAFPIFLILLWKYKPSLKSLIFGLFFTFIGSLLLSALSSHQNSFYSLATRTWELSAGSLVYFSTRFKLLHHSLRMYLYWFGWGLIAFSFTFLSNANTWPGLLALIPVSGASLLIMAQKSNSILVSNPISQWLGDRSYSLYLWHWPLVVALNYAGLSADWFYVTTAIILSLILGHISYQYIEVPTRQHLSDKSFQREKLTIIIITCLSLAAAFAIKKHNFNRQLPIEIQVASNEAFNQDPRLSECFKSANKNGTPACQYGSNIVGALLVGDSHASSVATAFGSAANKFNKGIIQLSHSACYPLENAKKVSVKSGKNNDECIILNKVITSKIQTFKTDIPVIIVSRMNAAIWGKNESGDKHSPRVFFTTPYEDGRNPIFQKEFKNAFKKWTCNIAKHHTVYLTRPIPEMGINVPDALSRNILFGQPNKDIKIPISEYHLRNKFIWSSQNEIASECGIKILNPLPYLCDKNYCYGSKGGHPLYFDDDHLSEHGNKFLIPMFQQIFETSIQD